MKVKVVGRRKMPSSLSWPDQGALARTSTLLRGRGLAPRGVFRFRTFEEAQAWMDRVMMTSSPVPPNPKTSSGSAED